MVVFLFLGLRNTDGTAMQGAYSVAVTLKQTFAKEGQRTIILAKRVMSLPMWADLLFDFLKFFHLLD